MLEFKIGDRVTFQPEGRPLVVGMLTRYNRKTVTIITDAGHQWNVSPMLIRKAVERDVTPGQSAAIINLRKP
jgi:hypothetical protein